jgi:hypothetical protein
MRYGTWAHDMTDERGQVQPLVKLLDRRSERGMPFHATQLSRCARVVRTHVAQTLHKNPLMTEGKHHGALIHLEL